MSDILEKFKCIISEKEFRHNIYEILSKQSKVHRYFYKYMVYVLLEDILKISNKDDIYELITNKYNPSIIDGLLNLYESHKIGVAIESM